MGEGNRLWNPDIAPTSPEQRTRAWCHYAALWLGMIVAVPGWMLAAGLIEQGMSALQATLTVLLGNVIILIPMLLIGPAGARYGIPFAVLVRASFGTIGARLPALARALAAGERDRREARRRRFDVADDFIRFGLGIEPPTAR